MEQRIAALKAHIRDKQAQLAQMIRECLHVKEPHTPYDPNDQWFSSGIICRNCGTHFHGWYCHTSPTKTCEYALNNEDCIHCHLPSERK